MPRSMKISEARGRLPELAKYLAKHPARVVLIEHRDLDERIALTTESHLRHLEAQVAELRKRLARPFQLSGSVTTELSDEELDRALLDLRAEQERLREEKLRDLAS